MKDYKDFPRKSFPQYSTSFDVSDPGYKRDLKEFLEQVQHGYDEAVRYGCDTITWAISHDWDGCDDEFTIYGEQLESDEAYKERYQKFKDEQKKRRAAKETAEYDTYLRLKEKYEPS